LKNAGKDNFLDKEIIAYSILLLCDLKNFYSKNLSPSVARMQVVGALPQATITSSLASLNQAWKARKVELPTEKLTSPAMQAQVFFVDVPDAKQSVLRIGYPALAATDKNYYAATVMNYILGGGGFASRLTQQLREGKGYTYGINSSFSGSRDTGVFTIASGVRSNVTLESAQLVKQILAEYGATYTEQDLATTKGFLIKSNARAFETAGAKLGMLENISKYGWKASYVKDREQIVKAMSMDQIKNLSQKYLDPNKMFWLVVGDAKTQLARMKELGFGEPVLLGK
ncbi:MAG: insulinase family protein, partial [Undibacterium sp.]|nr:insulinase family protein [Undibacterium sp.]